MMGVTVAQALEQGITHAEQVLLENHITSSDGYKLFERVFNAIQDPKHAKTVHLHIKSLLWHAEHDVSRRGIRSILHEIHRITKLPIADLSHRSARHVTEIAEGICSILEKKGFSPKLIEDFKNSITSWNIDRKNYSNPAYELDDRNTVSIFKQQVQKAMSSTRSNAWRNLKSIGVRFSQTASQALRTITSRTDRKTALAAGKGTAGAVGLKALVKNPGTALRTAANAVRATRPVIAVAKHPVVAAVALGTIAAGVAHLKGWDRSENLAVRALSTNIFGLVRDLSGGSYDMSKSSVGRYLKNRLGW
jgi:hypothetical protein